jgi:hypothetical protein
MKECTLGLLYVCKYGEIVFLFGWTVFSFINGLAFMNKADGDDNLHLRIMTGIALGLMVIHILYMNMLVNLRFWLRLTCVSLCKPIWDCSYYACCLKCMKPVCTDKCCSVGTALKWIVYSSYFGVMFLLVESWNAEQREMNEYGVSLPKQT